MVEKQIITFKARRPDMYNIDRSVKSHQKEFNPSVQVAALAELLPDDEIELICRQLGHTWRNRIFTPAVTVRSMVHRALNPDKSIRSTLVDLAALDDRLRQTPAEPAEASWCQARSRLPAELWPQLLQSSIKRLQQSPSGQYAYQKRPVYLIDGSTLSRQLPVRLIRLSFLHHGKPKLTWLVTTLQMNILRSKGPQAARYEVASTMLGYNLLRTVIHQAAQQNRVPANRISFATAIKMILAYSLSLRMAHPTQRQKMYHQMLHDIARHCNPLRPGRVEPRRVKRNDGHYPYLSIPCDLAK
jgi:hypothetical protein